MYYLICKSYSSTRKRHVKLHYLKSKTTFTLFIATFKDNTSLDSTIQYNTIRYTKTHLSSIDRIRKELIRLNKILRRLVDVSAKFIQNRTVKKPETPKNKKQGSRTCRSRPRNEPCGW